MFFINGYLVFFFKERARAARAQNTLFVRARARARKKTQCLRAKMTPLPEDPKQLGLI